MHQTQITEAKKLIQKLSKIDPLLYMFVITSVDKYAAMVLADETKIINDMRNNLISGEAWVDAAKNAQKVVNL
jgi:hypothetical protein